MKISEFKIGNNILINGNKGIILDIEKSSEYEHLDIDDEDYKFKLIENDEELKALLKKGYKLIPTGRKFINFKVEFITCNVTGTACNVNWFGCMDDLEPYSTWAD